ncbi:SDR family NAD(P)-dependent oxidoreductase [Pseudonocardia xishanensis]|uniref:SDR family NAD(P)-dependent oxidoreductase n=1 Tax=Pseudonocardia xishanensis TaxID=630995 RepID=A0ABP8RW02_9PSEU
MSFVQSADELAGKAAFVTGAGSGIGRAIAQRLADRGVRVVVADIDERSVREVAAELTGRGVEAVPVALDVADLAAWRAAAAVAAEAFGRVDILCNNAGVGPARATLDQLSDADLDLVLNVNVRGVLNGIRTFVPAMKVDGFPAQIVNTASILSHFALAGAGDYVLSKYAALAVSETLRAELAGTAVSVAVLCPGLVDTGLHKNTSALRGAAPTQEPTVTLDKPTPGMAPEHVGDVVVDAIVTGRFYVFPHPEYAEILSLRTGEIQSAITASQTVGDRDDTGYLGRSVLDLQTSL